MENDQILLSIIVPVYNVEKYLERCMESLLTNNLDNCEIILIDDGSTDSSGRICDQYINHRNINVIHKENGGLSDARNVGINNSKGKYLFFVDSDDFLEKKSLSIIKNELYKNDCDVLVVKSKLVYDDGRVEKELNYSIEKGIYSSSEYMFKLKSNPNSVIFCAPYHICKKELVEKINLRFEVGILHEDELWTPQLLINADKIDYLDCFCYYHFVREGSIMNSSNIKRSGYSDIHVANILLKVFNSSNRIDLEYVRDHMVTTYLQAVWKVPEYFSNHNMYSKTMPLKNSYYLKTKIKSLLFMLSPRLYYWVHKAFRLK